MKWRIHPGHAFDRLAPRWDAVNASVRNNPVLSSTFVGLLLRVFGDGHECIAECEDAGDVVAMAVLTRRRGVFWDTFQPSQAPLGPLVHARHVGLASLASTLVRDLPGFVLALGLTQQDSDLAPRPPDNPVLSTIDYIRTARVTIAGTFDQYWAARGKNLRTNVKRQLARLEKDGTKVSLDVVDRPEGIAEVIEQYGRLETAGWKGAAGTAIDPANAQGRFYRALLEDRCAHGEARAYRCRYGDAVAAIDLCVERAGTLVVLKTTYDHSIRDSSPAALLRHAYFRRIFDEGRIERIEFFGKLMDWHTKLTDETRVLYHLNAYRFAAIGRAHRALMRRTAQPAIAPSEPPTVPEAAGGGAGQSILAAGTGAGAPE